MRVKHEQFVKERLDSFDEAKQRDDEYYASLIEEFCKRVDVENWETWSSWVLGGGGDPSISSDIFDSLDKTRTWLLSRVWPNRYAEIESSLHNFRLVLNDFIGVFSRHKVSHGPEILATEKFYQIDEWDPQRYSALSREYGYHVNLVMDLMLELTRSINFACDQIRKKYHPSFRLHQGVVLVTDGPYMDLKYRTRRCEYGADERCEIPYPGLETFKTIRQARDHSFEYSEPKGDIEEGELGR